MSKIKRAGAWLLAAALAVGMLPAAGAASVPKPQTKTVKVTADNIYSSLGDVSVEVTYTGWLGEIASIPRDGASDWIGGPAGNTDKIAVLKEGSEIRFTIKAKDPMAYYNFCYDGIYTPDVFSESIVYGWDDCGGGTLYFYSKDGLQGYPIQVYGNKDGTSSFQPGNMFEKSQPFGRKLGSGQYAYTAHNGLLTYAFNAKPARDENNDYFPNDYTARYILGSALTVSDAQIKEMQETGTMTFLKGTEYEYQYAYPGVATLLGLAEKPVVEEPASDYSFKVTRVKPEFYSKDSNGDYILDNGASYGITFTNNTAEPLTREIAFVSYGKKLNEYAHLDAQIHYVSLNMAAHGTQAVNISSGFSRLSGGDYAFATVDFDDAADKRSFQSSVPMMENSDRAIDNSSKGIQWMRDTLGVTVK